METPTATELNPEIRAMRVAIAKDAIAQMDGPSPPTYLTGTSYLYAELPDDGPQLDPALDLKDVVDAVQPLCTVCQLGGLLLSKARLYDNVPLSRLLSQQGAGTCLRSGGQTAVRDLLADAFDGTTMRAVEDAFEGYLGPAGDYGLSLGSDYNAADRARGILTNLIANDGEFVIPAEFHAKEPADA